MQTGGDPLAFDFTTFALLSPMSTASLAAEAGGDDDGEVTAGGQRDGGRTHDDAGGGGGAADHHEARERVANLKLSRVESALQRMFSEKQRVKERGGDGGREYKEWMVRARPKLCELLGMVERLRADIQEEEGR